MYNNLYLFFHLYLKYVSQTLVPYRKPESVTYFENRFMFRNRKPILPSDWRKVQYINRAISQFLVKDFWQMSDVKLMNLIVEYVYENVDLQ